MCKKLTRQEFINKANTVHNFKYDYSLVNYINSWSKVVIICPLHGKFEQRANAHINSSQGCNYCGCIQAGKLQTSTLLDFINKANKIHNNKYDYSNTIYETSKKKVEIICSLHGSFWQTPGNHLKGMGCNKCVKHVSVFTRIEWINTCNNKICEPLVYVIRCFNETENFIKIGITSNPIKYRFSGKLLPYSYEIIKEIKGSPDFVFDKEIELQKLYKQYSYKPLISFSGETECFNISILEHIYK